MGRRGNGEGTIAKVKGKDLYVGKYYVDLPNSHRKRKAVYGKTREQTRDKMLAAMGDAAKGVYADDDNMSVSQWMDRWLEDSAKGDLASRTYHNYRLQIRRHINPALGRRRLSKLTGAHIQSLYAQKLRDGLKPSSVRYIHAVLHRALDQAVRFSLITVNPASRVDPPKIKQDEIEPLDADQTRTFLAVAKGDRYEALYALSLTCGLRMGEALGLKWSDIDMDKGTLRVNRQLQRIRRDGDKSGTLEFSEPKNASRRTDRFASEGRRSPQKPPQAPARGPACGGLKMAG